MKIAVISGSPRIEESRTLQYFRFLTKVFPEHDYSVYHTASEIIRMEKDSPYASSLIHQISRADLILQIFPVYSLSIPHPLLKFYEITEELPVRDYLRGKATASLSTSMKFFDHLAHQSVKWFSDLFDMNYIEGFSAAEEDIFSEEKQRDLTIFFEYIIAAAESKKFIRGRSLSPRGKSATIPYIPAGTKEPAPYRLLKKETDFRTVIVKEDDNESSLNRMVKEFTGNYPYPTEIFNLSDLKIKGSCTGCGGCFSDGKCIINDGFDRFLLEHIVPADLLILAQSLKNPSGSSAWKAFEERQFYSAPHSPRKGKIRGYIVSGPLSQIPLFEKRIKEAAMAGGESFCGIVSDEESRVVTGNSLDALAENGSRMLDLNYRASSQFPQVGASKLLRDRIFENRYLLPKDHKHYKKRNLYDFPHKKKREAFQSFILSLKLKFNSRYKSVSDFQKEAAEVIIQSAGSEDRSPGGKFPDRG